MHMRRDIHDCNHYNEWLHPPSEGKCYIAVLLVRVAGSNKNKEYRQYAIYDCLWRLLLLPNEGERHL
jgi:hypothetical protein